MTDLMRVPTQLPPLALAALAALAAAVPPPASAFAPFGRLAASPLTRPARPCGHLPTNDLPTEAFERRRLEGFEVLVERALLERDPERAQAALRLLELQLFQVVRAVPGRVLARLREVPIWLQANHEGVACACYHPSRDWLVEHGFNPDKARAVEIGNIAHFLDWTREQPWMVLHELMHAYHHRVLGYDHAGIRQAFEAARASGAYEAVLRYDGSTQRHYALSNEQEYFAESCEAWFGTNDFYPFVRAELIRHDPTAAQLLAALFAEDTPAALGDPAAPAGEPSGPGADGG